MRRTLIRTLDEAMSFYDSLVIDMRRRLVSDLLVAGADVDSIDVAEQLHDIEARAGRDNFARAYRDAAARAHPEPVFFQQGRG